ncbi:hypothetical protein DXG01_006712 [Tephrocybe rancida]|nr:hypothetical protein DXG01_006712 [Tephrocybe rancida]
MDRIKSLEADVAHEHEEKAVLAKKLADAQMEAVMMAMECNKVMAVAEDQEELEEEQQHSEDLGMQVREQLRLAEERNITNQMANVEPQSVPHPSGTAGQEWDIQMAMGLGHSARKDEVYKGIQAHEKIPFLKHFHNDWATDEIMKQYFQNKCKHHYKHGWLDVPRKFKHLKETSKKQKPAGSRVKRVKAVHATAQRHEHQGHQREGEAANDSDVDMNNE